MRNKDNNKEREKTRLLTVSHFALTECLIEALAEAQVRLVLSTFQELFDLPGAGACGRSRRGALGSSLRCCCFGHGSLTAPAEESGHGMTDGVSHGGSDSDTTSGGSHLAHEGWLLRLDHGRRRRDLSLGWQSGWGWGRRGCASDTEIKPILRGFVRHRVLEERDDI